GAARRLQVSAARVDRGGDAEERDREDPEGQTRSLRKRGEGRGGAPPTPPLCERAGAARLVERYFLVWSVDFMSSDFFSSLFLEAEWRFLLVPFAALSFLSDFSILSIWVSPFAGAEGAGVVGAGVVGVWAIAGPTTPTANTVAATRDITRVAFIENSSLFAEICVCVCGC